MSGLVDTSGRPLSSSSYAKAAPPKLGEAFGAQWGTDQQRMWMKVLGNYGLVQFDLSKLSLEDFRVMRDHYQINATLAAMSFMLHQMDWRVTCASPKIQKFVQANIEEVWTQLVRACSQAHWAGFAPCILQFENDPISKSVQLTKIKDLIPENTRVNWKQVDGYSPPGMLPPKINVFDGMKIWGQGWPVPADNTFWYPLMMENGDMYGRKLLRSAFTSWYFSLLMHLFANRYFERFGEPVPIGRAPYDEEITINSDGKPVQVNGAVLMGNILQNLRNRSVVVLPNTRTPVTNSSTATGDVEFDFDIEYLESQMRGADFERYLGRLDEEMSLAMFTPLLVLRTADVGSYNLGSTHWTMYLNMLNALSGDMKTYIDKFILDKIVDYNFGPGAPRARMFFRKMGSDKMPLITAIVQALIPTGTVKPDLEELGDIAGLSFDEIQVITSKTGDPAGEKPGDSAGNDKVAKTKKTATDTVKTGGTKPTKKNSNKLSIIRNSASTVGVLSQITTRVSGQITKACKDSYADSFELSLGYQRQLANTLDVNNSGDVVVDIYEHAMSSISDVPLDVFRAMTREDIDSFVNLTLEASIEKYL